MATNSLLAGLTPELLARAQAYFNGGIDPATGNGPGAAFYDPATGLALRRAENPLLNGYSYAGSTTSEPNGPGTSQHLYDAAGTYTGERVRPTYGFMDRVIASSLPAYLMMAGPFAAAAMGVGAGAAGAAGAGAAEAGAAGGSLAGGAGLGTTGASLTGGIGTTTGLGYGVGTLPTLAGASYGSGALGLDAALAGMGAAGAAGGAAGASFGGGSGTDFLSGGTGTDTLSEVPSTFNAAKDSQLANAAIEAAGGDALAGYTAAGVPSVAAAGGGASTLGSLLGHSGTNTIGDAAGGFDWTKLIGPGLSAIGGIAGANAAQSAADAQLQAAREAQAKLEPWYQAGGWAVGQGANMLGKNGQQAATAAFQQDPGYQFRLTEGQKALERARSSTGSLGTGKYLKDLTAYNQGQASQEFGNSFNRLMALGGMGQAAANTSADYGTQAGNAAAAGKIGSMNALFGGIGQGVSLYQNQQLADQNKLFQTALMNRWLGS